MMAFVLRCSCSRCRARRVPPPAGHSADWDAGWTARDVYEPSPPATGPSTAPTTNPVPTSAKVVEVAALLSGAKDGETIALPLADAYSVTGTPRVLGKSITVDFGGKTVYLTPAAGASTAIAVGPIYGPSSSGAAFTIRNANFLGVARAGTVATNAIVAIRAYSPGLTLTACSVDNVNCFLELDRQTVPGKGTDAGGADDATVTSCSGGLSIGGDFIFNTCDNSHITCKVLRSLGQHNVRQDVNADGHLPTGNVYDHCELTNTNGKETLAIRMGDAIVQYCLFHGWARAGQNKAKGVGSNAKVAWLNCHWDTQIKGGCQLDCVEGVEFQVIGCQFDAFASDDIAISAGTDTNDLTLTNNVRHVAPAGLTLKYPLCVPVGKPAATVHETGTVVKP